MVYESEYSNPSWFCFVSWYGLEPSTCEVALTLKFRREILVSFIGMFNIIRNASTMDNNYFDD